MRVIQLKGHSCASRQEQIDVRGYAVGFKGLIEGIWRSFPLTKLIEQSLTHGVTYIPEQRYVS